MKVLTKFLTNEQGTETVEWAIMIGLIGDVSMAVIPSINCWVHRRYTSIHGVLPTNAR